MEDGNTFQITLRIKYVRLVVGNDRRDDRFRACSPVYDESCCVMASGKGISAIDFYRTSYAVLKCVDLVLDDFFHDQEYDRASDTLCADRVKQSGVHA